MSRRHKFNAKPVVIDGIKFPSTFEGKIYRDTKLLLKTGEAVSVELQKRYNLYGKNGHKICTHAVDFLIEFDDGHHEVWEAKGFETAVWKLKKKLFEDNYPDIKYVVHSKNRKRVRKGA